MVSHKIRWVRTFAQVAAPVICISGMAPRAKQIYLDSQMMTAVEYSGGDPAPVRDLLDAGAHVDVRDVQGYTPLHWAVRFNHKATVRFLLSHGANVNAADETGCTALIHAATAGNPDIVADLLRHGANVNTPNKEGKTALAWTIESAAGARSYNPADDRHEQFAEVIRLLKEAGAAK